MAPLRLGGLRGKKNTHSIGWKVSVKSLLLESKGKQGAQDFEGIFIKKQFIGSGIFIF
jgi:hypothetical protein